MTPYRAASRLELLKPSVIPAAIVAPMS
jgi:hypothetical protein